VPSKAAQCLVKWCGWHGMQRVKAWIGLAVPGRPIGPRSRKTGAPEAAATGRDRSRRYTVGTRGAGR
jgi:hypothetical protein